ncbi:uncharacterized protein SCDLUD_000164 [Saccharomycodes ludwigii]|uniref:uncharacterized protein n=1 Tax=Saccharomycodes ludwigii TaxID=36035 RepID=UPI001E8441D0|nr:hypothetical protein SCDLUD_000164 [Saccharomycodes ludwigii]KAH3902584.1 hypothetical protein SCDLUD_000164 [Saccharomycodes ludwigii]
MGNKVIDVGKNVLKEQNLNQNPLVKNNKQLKKRRKKKLVIYKKEPNFSNLKNHYENKLDISVQSLFKKKVSKNTKNLKLNNLQNALFNSTTKIENVQEAKLRRSLRILSKKKSVNIESLIGENNYTISNSSDEGNNSYNSDKYQTNEETKEKNSTKNLTMILREKKLSTNNFSEKKKVALTSENLAKLQDSICAIENDMYFNGPNNDFFCKHLPCGRLLEALKTSYSAVRNCILFEMDIYEDLLHLRLGNFRQMCFLPYVYNKLLIGSNDKTKVKRMWNIKPTIIENITALSQPIEMILIPTIEEVNNFFLQKRKEKKESHHNKSQLLECSGIEASPLETMPENGKGGSLFPQRTKLNCRKEINLFDKNFNSNEILLDSTSLSDADSGKLGQKDKNDVMEPEKSIDNKESVLIKKLTNYPSKQ